MKKYKVTLKRLEFFTVDVIARDTKHATKLAIPKFKEIDKNGMEHYIQEGETALSVDMVFDVTNTDDQFNP